MTRRSRTVLATALCVAMAGGLAIATPGGAQERPADAEHMVRLPAPAAGLGLARAVALAVAWHPSVRSAHAQVFEAGDHIQAARAGYYPQVSAGLTSERGNRNLPGYDSRQVHRFVVSLSQMLYDFGKVGSMVESSRAQEAVARARLLLTVDDVARDAAQAWVEVRRYEALLEVADDQQRGVTAIADLVRERRRQGASPRSDEMQAQAREEAARAFELEAGAQLRRWRMQLEHLTGLEAVSGTRDAIPAAVELACSLPDRAQTPPSVLVAQAEVRVAQADLDGARAQARPTVSLDGSIGRGLDADSRLGESHDSTVMLNVSAPLYQGGGNQARQRAAGHARAAAEAALDDARLASSRLLQDARTQAGGSAQRRSVLDERVRSLEQTRTLYAQQYLDLGTRSLLDLLNAEQEYQQARMERANNTHDLLRAQVDCLYAGGRLREAFEIETRLAMGTGAVP